MSAQGSKGISKSQMTWLSLWTVYLIWGSTYFAIAYVIESMPPLLAMGIRFLIAGLLLALIISFRQGVGELKIPRAELRSSLLMGFLLLGFGIGTVSIAQAYVPSGIVALIIAALPLWIAIFRTISGERLAKTSWLGLAIGFAGVALLLKPGSISPVSEIENSKLFLFMLLVLLGNIGWALGTFLAPRFPLPKNTLVFTAYEMLAGGASLTLAGFIKGESISDFLDATSWSWLWFVYLIIFGSIAAYSAYLWLVANAPVSLTATYAYVNPIIAVALGAIFLDELITGAYAIGGLIILIGVILVVSVERIKKEPAI
ncbi:drug/metabolite exporter YedA [Actinomycetes bacterium]|jgi:drug/metabolite transporter (DMT)-like permease|nr:drug/metabolite exporter YedA [Actinomycetes bacterium]